jgi:hypothetical protein
MAPEPDDLIDHSDGIDRGEAAAGVSRAGLVPLLACLAAWSAWFIFRSSFVYAGKRVFCLFEDAMISMTYARSLVEGHGLNWARFGAPVEGFTHPLWTALMVPVNALSFLDLRYRSALVQLLSLAILLVHVTVVRRLMLRHFAGVRARHWLPAALLTASYYPLNYWALMGMESGLQALLTTLSVLLALDIVCLGRDRHRQLLLVGAAAYLLRMDMLLIVLVVQAFVLGCGGLRREQRAGFFQGVAVLAGVVIGYGAFRWLYFGELLPNTYYLKLDQVPLAVRLMRGTRMLSASLSDHLLLLVAVGMGVLVLLRELPARGAGLVWRRRLLLPALLFATACAYSIWVGGDAWEMSLNVRANRFVVYVMPLVFVLFGGLLNLAADQLSTGLFRRYLVAMATALALLVADGLWMGAEYPENWFDLAVATPPLMVGKHVEVFDKLRRLQRAIGTAGVVATGPAGIPSYFSDYRMVDLFGYNERHIARLPPALPLALDNYADFLPGHAKWSYAWVLARYHPDAFLQPFPPQDPGPLLSAAGYHRDPSNDFWTLAGPMPAPGVQRPAGGSR